MQDTDMQGTPAATQAAADGPVADRPTSRATDFAALLGALNAALTDTGVERMTALGEEWIGILGSQQVRDLVGAALPLIPYMTDFANRLRPLVEAGLLDRVLEAATLLSAVMDAVTPMQAERLAVEAEGLVGLANNVMSEDPGIMWRTTLDRLLTTWQETSGAPRPVGLSELLRLRKDPGVQRALRAMLALAHFAEPPH